MNKVIKKVKQWHDQFFGLVSYSQSPFLLFVRLYWGWQFMQSGWGKLHHLSNVTEFFTGLNLPAPAIMAVFIASLEFFGGLLLFIGLLSRPISLVLTVNMIMAYVMADREALFSFFSDPGKFYVADPYTFLFASLLILFFGAGKISVDTALAYLFGFTRAKQANSVQ